MISVEDLRKWADEHAIGRSASYPRGWLGADDLRRLALEVERCYPLDFHYSQISNVGGGKR